MYISIGVWNVCSLDMGFISGKGRRVMDVDGETRGEVVRKRN